MLILLSLICLTAWKLPSFSEPLSDNLHWHQLDRTNSPSGCILASTPMRCRVFLLHVALKTAKHNLTPQDVCAGRRYAACCRDGALRGFLWLGLIWHFSWSLAGAGDCFSPCLSSPTFLSNLIQSGKKTVAWCLAFTFRNVFLTLHGSRRHRETPSKGSQCHVLMQKRRSERQMVWIWTAEILWNRKNTYTRT